MSLTTDDLRNIFIIKKLPSRFDKLRLRVQTNESEQQYEYKTTKKSINFMKDLDNDRDIDRDIDRDNDTYYDRDDSEIPLSPVSYVSEIKEEYRQVCECGRVCSSCYSDYFQKLLDEFKVKECIDEIYNDIVKKMDVENLTMQEKNTVETTFINIKDLEQRNSALKKAKQNRETIKKISMNKKIINTFKCNFKYFIENVKDRAYYEKKKYYCELFAQVAKKDAITEQEKAMLKLEGQHAMSLAVKYFNLYYSYDSYIGELSNMKTIKGSSIHKIPESSYVSDVLKISADTINKQHRIEHDFNNRLRAFDEEMKAAKKTIQEIEREKQLLAKQLEAEKAKALMLLNTEKMAKYENSTRSKFEKIVAVQKSTTVESELNAEITLLREALKKSEHETRLKDEIICMYNNKILNPGINKVALPENACVDYLTYGVRVYVSNLYPDHVWRNGNWYRKGNIKFEDLSLNIALANNLMTDDFVECNFADQRLFCYAPNRISYYIYNPSTFMTTQHAGECSFINCKY